MKGKKRNPPPKQFCALENYRPELAPPEWRPPPNLPHILPKSHNRVLRPTIPRSLPAGYPDFSPAIRGD